MYNNVREQAIDSTCKVLYVKCSLLGIVSK